jgi:hypothetical protein
MDWKLVTGLFPPVFTLAIMWLSRGADSYVRRQSEIFCTINAFTIAGDAQKIAAFALSAVALKDHIITLLSGVATMVIIFHDWPQKYQYYGTGLAVLLFVIYLANWFWQVMSLDMAEIVGAKVRTRSGNRSYTYAQLFTVQQTVFNALLIVLVLIGWYLNT